MLPQTQTDQDGNRKRTLPRSLPLPPSLSAAVGVDYLTGEFMMLIDGEEGRRGGLRSFAECERPLNARPWGFLYFYVILTFYQVLHFIFGYTAVANPQVSS